ncbi:MAG: hypothetical protein J6334_00430 [Kiritimatiellae bacterium]|nr:hypothetical protein [Kiritimatiellia bacterium]
MATDGEIGHTGLRFMAVVNNQPVANESRPIDFRQDFSYLIINSFKVILFPKMASKDRMTVKSVTVRIKGDDVKAADAAFVCVCPLFSSKRKRAL